MVDEATGSYTTKEYADFVYTTQGKSLIFEAGVKTAATNNENPNAEIETYLQTDNKKGPEITELLSISKNYEAYKNIGDNAATKEDGNSLEYVQAALGSGNHFRDVLQSAVIKISQEVDPVLTYNTSEETIDGGRINVLDGANKWLGPNSGAFELTAKDEGIGISGMFVYYYPSGKGRTVAYENNLISEGDCSGIQCPETVANHAYVYTNKELLPDGDDVVTANIKDAGGGWAGEEYFTLKVDSTPPHNVELAGSPSNGVINEAQYHLQTQATDGSGTTPSSGIKSIEIGELNAEGKVHQVGTGKSGSCTPGPCTATGEWTLNGETLGAGKHNLVVVATDNAGNVEKNHSRSRSVMLVPWGLGRVLSIRSPARFV